jgi:transcriptional regulator with XRE-family HTH domain
MTTPAVPRLRLRELRAERGMSQRELARKAGISLLMAVSVEEGSMHASSVLIARLAKALGITVEDLVEETPAT